MIKDLPILDLRGESSASPPSSKLAGSVRDEGEFQGVLTSAIAPAESDQSTAERYESLIRNATSIRAQKDPRELFGILVHELDQVLQFDAIAQFDEASKKVAWHLCPGCQKPENTPCEDDND